MARMDTNTPMDPHEAERHFAKLLDEAELACFTAFTWAHGFSLHQDLTREIGPIDEWERAGILGVGPM